MANLLEETIYILKTHGKKEKDVKWVGTANGKHAIKWSKFTEIADFEYDSGYGGVEIDGDLVVVGDDWWLERHEYDGSEWWEFKSIPQPKPKAKTLKSLLAK